MTTKDSKMFDKQKLLKLAEPLTMRLGKISNGREMEIPLPAKSDANNNTMAVGEGYTYPEAEQFGSLALSMGGGGEYRIQASDNRGGKYEWFVYFPISSFPEKTPPTMAASSPQPAAPFASMQPPQSFQGQPSDWFARTVAAAAAAGASQPPPSFQPFQPWGQPFQPFPAGHQPAGYQGFSAAPWQQQQPWAFGAPPPAPAPQVGESRERALEQQIQQLREAQLARDAAAERDRVQQQSQAQISALAEELRRMREQRPSAADDPAFQQLREQNQRLQQALEEQRREQAQSQQNGVLQQMMLQQQQQFSQLVQVLTARPTGPDPTMQILLESNRQQMEAMKESTRLQVEALREQSRSQTTARDVLDMAERFRQSSGVDQLMPKMAEAYSGAWSMIKQGMEAIQGMKQGDSVHPAMQMAGDALAGIQEGVKEYLKMKRDASVGEMAWKRAEAEAQRARAEADKAQAGAFAGAPGPEPQVREQPTTPSNGHTPAPPPEPQPAPPPNGHAAAPAQEPQSEPKPPTREEQIAAVEMRLFGPALEFVKKLRTSVKNGNIQPDHVAGWSYQGYAGLQERGWKVEAFKFFENAMFADYVDVLLPDAPQEYRDRCVQALYAAHRRIQEGGQIEVPVVEDVSGAREDGATGEVGDHEGARA